MAEHSEVLGLAAKIVSAHVSHNAVPSDQLPGLILQVFNSLATAEQATMVPPKSEFAVTVRQSVTAGYIVCLDWRQALLDVEAAPDDRSQADTRAVQAAMGVATVLPSGHPASVRASF